MIPSVFFLTLLAASQAWLLETNHHYVESGLTKDVQLLCHFDSSKEKTKMLTELLRIRIYRMDNDGFTHNLAGIGIGDKTKTHEDGITAISGFPPKENVHDSFLKVVWPIATNTTVGKFRCDVDGYNADGGSHPIKTNTIVIEEKTYTLEDLKMMIDRTKSEFRKKETEMKKEIEGLKMQLVNSNDASKNARQQIVESIYQAVEQRKNENTKEHKTVRDAITVVQQDLKSFKDLVNSEYVRTNTFSHQMSASHNFTADALTEQKERISGLKKFTIKELAKFDQTIQENYQKITNTVRNETIECKNLYLELTSDVSVSKDQLMKKINALQKRSDETNHTLIRRLDSLDNRVTFVADNNQNATKSFQTDLTILAKCACPTLIFPVSTADPIPQDGKSTMDKKETTTSSAMGTDKITVVSHAQPTTRITTMTTPKINEWPEGAYAIVEPEVGCPKSDGFTWEEGWITFHTASDENDDLVSPGNHFRKPIFRTDGIDNFMRINFCLRRNGDPKARKWPKGSYCMNRVGGKCPSGFTSTYIQYDGEHSHVQHEHKNSPDIRSVDGSLDVVYYCCRNDGPATSAIYLPITSPFFLYRANKAQCQRVSGMNMRSEIIQIDTSHEDNEDKFEIPDTHPFAALNPVNHTLCYYSPV